MKQKTIRQQNPSVFLRELSPNDLKHPVYGINEIISFYTIIGKTEELDTKITFYVP